jgi:thymidine kinase
MSKLIFFYSSMGAGKSLDLLRINHNYMDIGMNPILLKPSMDTRWGKDKITSRIGISHECISFDSNEDIHSIVMKQVEDYKEHGCVLVDEAQFLTKNQVWQLCDIVDWLDISVLCFGLRTDSNGNLFTGSKHLLALADELNEVQTLCHCGNSATMTLRYCTKTNEVIKDEEDEESILVGDEGYKRVCRRCWTSSDTGTK